MNQAPSGSSLISRRSGEAASTEPQCGQMPLTAGNSSLRSDADNGILRPAHGFFLYLQAAVDLLQRSIAIVQFVQQPLDRREAFEQRSGIYLLPLKMA